MKNLIIFCISLITVLHAWTEDGTSDLKDQLQLFTDPRLIEEMEGVSLQMGRPEAAETVLVFDQPWEGRYCGYATVIQDGALYRLYYRGNPQAGRDGSEGEVTCYAESQDGILWTKPNLGLYGYGDHSETNIILKDNAPFSHNFAPFLDQNPAANPARRFKALAGTSESGLVGFASADGIHWQKIQDAPLITKGAFDSQNVAFWSEAEGCYVCYFRTWTSGEFNGFRTISRVTSPDFLTWSDPVEIEFGDTPREHLYTNQTQPYFRAPHLYIATPARFMPGRRVLTEAQFQALGGEAQYSGDCSDTVLMTSRGGNRFDRTFMEAFIRPGLGLKNWSSRTNYMVCGMIPTGEGELSMYMQKDYGQTSHHLQRYRLRWDGFASVHAPYEEGSLLTKPFVYEGKELILNYATSAAGSIWVEIQDMMGKTMPGFSHAMCDEIIGDQIERVVTWQGRSIVSCMAGKPVRLLIHMKDADLYSFRFRKPQD